MWKQNQTGAESRWQVSIISTAEQTVMAILMDKDPANGHIQQSGPVQGDTDAWREAAGEEPTDRRLVLGPPRLSEQRDGTSSSPPL